MAASQVSTVENLSEQHDGWESVGACINSWDYFARQSPVCVIDIAFSYTGASLGITSDGFFQLEELPR